MATDMAKMKHNAIVGNIGHFDNEIDMAGLFGFPGIKRQNIKPQCDRFIFPDGHGVIILAEGRLLNLGCATGHPSFVMSCSFTNQVRPLAWPAGAALQAGCRCRWPPVQGLQKEPPRTSASSPAGAAPARRRQHSGLAVVGRGCGLQAGPPTPAPRAPPAQVIAQLELWNERHSGRYEKKVYVLPKHLDEKVAALHLDKLGAKLTKLTDDQAKYINVPIGGPYKPTAYRY
jgi:hypothetical protein